jgi:hypothetical protein
MTGEDRGISRNSCRSTELLEFRADSAGNCAAGGRKSRAEPAETFPMFA